MRKNLKILLVLEVLVAFGPLASMWSLGAMMAASIVMRFLSSPARLVSLWEESGPGLGMFLGLVACGLCGLLALFQMLARLLGDRRPFERPWLVIGGVLLGLLPIVPFLAEPEAWRSFWIVAPIASTAHIVYLSRRLLFPRRAREGLLT